MARELKPCGTVAAAVRHRLAGEPVCADCAAAWREYQRANRSKWKREPRVPLHIQLADECVLADRLARALTRVVCQDCQHAACESARLVVFDWMAKRGSNG